MRRFHSTPTGISGSETPSRKRGKLGGTPTRSSTSTPRPSQEDSENYSLGTSSTRFVSPMESHGSTNASGGGFPTGYAGVARVFRDSIVENERAGRVERNADGGANLTSTSSFSGAGSSGDTPSVPRPLLKSYSAFVDGEIIFHNKFMIKGWGFASKRIAHTSHRGHIKTSSLLMLPVFHLSMYLSASEYQLLPEMARVE